MSEEFINSAPQPEKILTADEVPYGIPVVFSNVQKLENNKFNSFTMQGQVAVNQKQLNGKWMYLAALRKKFNVEVMHEELERKVAAEAKDDKMTVPNEGLQMVKKRSSFVFYLPKRLCDICSDAEKLSSVNSKTYLGMFVGKKKTSMCLVLVALTPIAQPKRRTTLQDEASSSKQKPAIIDLDDAGEQFRETSEESDVD